MQVNDTALSHGTEADLAKTVERLAGAVKIKKIICVTQDGALAQHLGRTPLKNQLLATTVNEETYAQLTNAGLETIHLPLYAADKYNQVRHVLSVASRAGKVNTGDFIMCVIGRNVYPEARDLIVLTHVDAGIERLAITDVLKLTDGIRPKALEATLAVASRIGSVVRRGADRIGAIFVLGDSLNVLKNSRQLVPNPFQGHDEELRQITNPDIHDALVEFAKLDGAFVIRGDGLIQSAGAFLITTDAEIELPTGLGARHVAAAAATARTEATAIVVSSTDGMVRIFSKGQVMLQLDPEVPYGSFMDAE